MIILRLRCAYCPAAFPLQIGVSQLDLFTRSGLCLYATCPKCDSTFELWFATKRKRKGKRLRAMEAKAKAELAARVAEAERANDVIAARMLAEPGCTCAIGAEARYDGGYNEARRDGLRSGYVIDGIPGPPRHRYGCPCYHDPTP